MNKETLTGFGLTDEQANKVIGELDGAYVPKARFNEINGELRKAQTDLKTRDEQFAALQGATGDADALRQQIANLQAEAKDQAEKHAEQLRKTKADAETDRALTTARARHLTAAKALLAGFLECAEIGEDGSIKGLEGEIARLRGDQETAFLFEDSVPKAPPITGATPAGALTTSPESKPTNDYLDRYKAAKAKGDTLGMIAAKNEAHQAGNPINP
jgi:hypothetical protein